LRSETSERIPELDVPVDLSRVGLVPRTLRPLLVKRIAIKEHLAGLTALDCRTPALKARAAALKWLLVVCFGYLGYKNARFGRIESHEAVTAYGRDCLLRAKEAAEDLGYEVLHMYVDGLWVKKPGVRHNEQVRPLLDEITRAHRPAHRPGGHLQVGGVSAFPIGCAGAGGQPLLWCLSEWGD
jgi:DNA polymerase-2